ncbi:ketopantoate reductase family protein [Bauldia sp.]|uniref:ketopantoate reductase family protein n=1 Tax=Bauldia sp. TaxID=2575872 RepID=UPI003BAD7601
MRIAVIGAGAMGCTFGAHFAKAGVDVILFDKDADHIAAIAANGLRFATPDRDSTVRLAATTDATVIDAADVALMLVDSAATADVVLLVVGCLGPDGFALTLQNGIGNIEALSETLGAERVVAGSTYNSAARLEPGHVLHSNTGETVIGELDGHRTRRIDEVAALFADAGLPIEVSDNVLGHVWMKFVLNAAINPVSALTGLRAGEIVRTPSARQLLERLLDEILAVTAAKGITLSEPNPRAAVLDHAWERYNRPSMLQHVETGRRTEIEALNGALLKEAAALGIACPINEAVTLSIRSIDARADKRRNVPNLDEAALEAAARAEPRPI